MRRGVSKILATRAQGTPAAYVANVSSPPRRRAESFTVDERSFRNPKLRNASLIAYKAFADLAAKSSLFVITIAAARRLSPHAFGVFSLGSTLGWILAVVTDFRSQSVRGSGGEKLAVRHHDRRGAASIAARVRRLLTRVDARVDPGRRDRLRDSDAPRARRGEAPRGRAPAAPVVAPGTALDGVRRVQRRDDWHGG